MTNMGKYRKLSYIAIAFMATAMLLSFAALWNSLLTTDAKHEGWIILFFLLTFSSGVFLFYVAYKFTNADELDRFRISSYELGKNEILQEIEKRNKEELKEKIEEEDIDKNVEAVLAGIKNVRTEAGLCNKILTNLANQLGFVQGIIYVKEQGGEIFNVAGEYALTGMKPKSFRAGENLPGQVVDSKSPMTVYDIPEKYFNVASGLGQSKPRFLVLAPILFKEECIAVLELAAFKKPDALTGKVLDRVLAELGTKLNKLVVAS